METGSIIHIDYDLFNVDSDELIETTREEVAKEHDVYDENRTYKPLVTVVGDGRLIAGFETHLEGAEADTDYEFDIPPEDAYGERDPNSIETIGQDVLFRSVREPESVAVGGSVEIGGKTGVLKMIRAGRARIDYNHPLAGRTLRYSYKIVKVIEDREEKVLTLLETNAGRDGFEISFDGDDLTIDLPEFVSYDQNWAYTKFTIIQSLRDHVGAQTIVLREVHEAREIGEEE
jgi:FKBP-type peptidyl-prolyl cis-trans isomerase 2